jgi:hypothetical protein
MRGWFGDIVARFLMAGSGGGTWMVCSFFSLFTQYMMGREMWGGDNLINTFILPEC